MNVLLNVYASNNIITIKSNGKKKLQAPVVQKLDSAIHRINYHPVDKC